MRISLLTIRQRAAVSRGQPRKSQSYLYDSRHDGSLDSSRIYTTPGTNRLMTSQTLALTARFPRGFGCFSRIKFFLGRTETRTRDRMYCQLIRTVRDISRDDRAIIATCCLQTLTDRHKENYSIDVYTMYIFLTVFSLLFQ